MSLSKLAAAIAAAFIVMSPASAGDATHYDIIPNITKQSQASSFSNVTNWASLSTVDPGASCASCYGRMFWPLAMPSGPSVYARFAITSPAEARLFSFQYVPNGSGGFDVVYDYNWPIASAASLSCVCYLAVDVTAKWNAIKNGPNNFTGIFVQVKGTGVIYQARVEVLEYP